MTVTSGRSNLRGALHSTFLRDSYYWDGTIVRTKAGDPARFGRIDARSAAEQTGKDL